MRKSEVFKKREIDIVKEWRKQYDLRLSEIKAIIVAIKGNAEDKCVFYSDVEEIGGLKVYKFVVGNTAINILDDMEEE